MLKRLLLFSSLCLFHTASVGASSRPPLAYASIPTGTYQPPKNASTITLLDFLNLRDDLSNLLVHVKNSAGFTQAFETNPSWQFTFFAPSNDAFNNTGNYFSTYYDTLKGKFWFGNILMHHYVPGSTLKVSDFNGTATRLQTGSYLYVQTQTVDGTLTLNQVAKVVDGDHAVTNGVVHIVDRILDPSAMILEADIATQKQGFIAGSCSNMDLPYC